MVPVRHWLARHELKANLWHLAVGGALIGYLTGIVVSTGPLSVPLFLFYGLAKGAFLATEAASSLGLYLSKSVTFERFGALTSDVAIKGLIAGSSLMFGAFIAKRFVLKLEPDMFRLVMDGIMLAAGAFAAVDGDDVVKSHQIQLFDLNQISGIADGVTEVTASSGPVTMIAGFVTYPQPSEDQEIWDEPGYHRRRRRGPRRHSPSYSAAGTPSIRPSAACCCAPAP